MSDWFSPTPAWGAEVWRLGGEVGGENGRPPSHRVDGASVEATMSVQTTTGCSLLVSSALCADSEW